MIMLWMVDEVNKTDGPNLFALTTYAIMFVLNFLSGYFAGWYYMSLRLGGRALLQLRSWVVHTMVQMTDDVCEEYPTGRMQEYDFCFRRVPNDSHFDFDKNCSVFAA